MTLPPKRFPPAVFIPEAEAILHRLVEEDDERGFERRFGRGLLQVVAEDPAESVGAVAFALAMERAIEHSVPDDVFARCAHFRAGIGPELTISLPHRTAFCAACRTEFAGPDRVVGSAMCEVCRTEKASKSIGIPFRTWTVDANLCPDCAEWVEGRD
jgi:hypothetical protein